MNEAINKIVDVPKLVKTIWIILWITLLMFLGLKLCFNIWYPIVVESKTFIKVCDFIDNHLWLEFSIGIILYVYSLNIWVLSAIKKKKFNKKELILFNILFLIGYVIKFFYNFLGSCIELVYLILIPMIINLKNNFSNNVFYKLIYIVLIYIIINIWQINILFIRNINDVLSNCSSMIYYIMQIDYYIFLNILWIGVSFMGFLSGGFFWGKSETELLEIKEKELKKEFPNKSLIEKIDKRLAKIKK